MSSGESTEREWRDRAWAAEERASIAEAEVARLRTERDSLGERIAAVRALIRNHADPTEAQEFMDALGLA